MSISENDKYGKYCLLTPADETNDVKSAMSGERPIVLMLWTVEATYEIEMVPDRVSWRLTGRLWKLFDGEDGAC
jgi:hypothetical protein